MLRPVHSADDHSGGYRTAVQPEGVDDLSELVVLLGFLVAVEVALNVWDVALQVPHLCLQLLHLLLTLRLVSIEELLRALHSGNLLLQLGTLQEVGVT